MTFGRMGLGLGHLGSIGSAGAPATPRTLYEVGGTGNWPDTAKWALTSGGAGGNAAPVSVDAATLDGSSGGGTLTMTGTVNAASITMGAFTGTLAVNGQTVNVGTFSGTGTGTRTLNLANSTLNVTGTGSCWNFSTVTNLTFTSTGSVINITGSGARTLNFGAISYGTVNVTGSGAVTSGNQNATFVNLNRTGTASPSDSMIVGNWTVSGLMTFAGNSAAYRLGITSSATGTTRTLTPSGTRAVSNTDFANITISGAELTGTSLGDCGGNTNIAFDAAKDSYWVGGSGNYSDAASHCASSTGGAPALSNYPLPQDRLIVDANSFTSAGQTLTMDAPRIGAQDWSAVTNNPTLNFPSNFNIYGNVDIPAINFPDTGGVTMTGTGVGTFANQSGTIDVNLHLTAVHLNAKGFPTSISVNAPGGTVRLQSHFQNAGLLTLTAGTLTANNYDVQCTFFRGTGTATRVLNLGSGTWTCTSNGTLWDVSSTGMTLNAGTSTIRFYSASSPSRTFNGGGLTYYNFIDTYHDGLDNSGAPLIITGANTFNEFRVDSQSVARSVTFPAGVTNTFASFIADGRVGALCTLQSSSPGSPATLSQASGTVTMDRMIIKDITATGGATWNATNSTNGGGNTGINFI